MQYYGIMFWMPLLLSALHPAAPPPVIALLTAIPYSCASAFMLANAAHSKRTKGRRLHVAVPLVLGGVALALSPHAAAVSGTLGLALLAVATAGVWGVYGPFWSWPAVGDAIPPPPRPAPPSLVS